MTTTFVIDISNNQPLPYDFNKVKASGVGGVIIKVSEGTYYRNELLDQAWKGAKDAGLVVGGYHYAVPRRSGAVQEAQHFIASLPALGPGDLVALDQEDPNSQGLGDLSDWTLLFLNTVRNALGFLPFVYSYPDYFTRLLTKVELAPYPLWLADLGNPRKTSFNQWPSIPMSQFTWTSRNPGINNGLSDVDMSEFYGSVDQLRKYGKPAPKPVYPYTTRVIQRAMIKAAGRPGQPFAGQPSHSSPGAIDAQHHEVWATAGETLQVTGDDVHTDDIWRPVRLPEPSPVHGWLLDRNLYKLG